jgi:RHS repeat-associated protein
VVGLTASNGNEVNAYDYDPYGVMLNETQGQPNPFQYEAGYFESSTGLVKFGTRYYNPQLGRWTQQDPVGGSLSNPDALNRYLYVSDDPVSMRDSSGRFTFGCYFAIALNFFAIGAEIAVIWGLLTIWAPYVTALLAASLALGPWALAFAAWALTVAFVIAVMYNVYQIVQALNTVINACNGS